MLTQPLHHAYIASGQASKCAQVVRKHLEDNFAGAGTEGLEINAAVVDTMTVEEARKLASASRLRSQDHKRCFIRGFETITNEAQNTLLKALEEPAKGVHFFLITPSPDELLETVRSRANRINICSHSVNSDTAQLVDDFLSTDSTADRLAVVEAISNRQQLRSFLQKLLAETPFRRRRLRSAVGLVSQWVNDTGSSVSQLAEYLAIAARSEDTE